MKIYEIAMIASKKADINYNGVTYGYTMFYVCNNAQHRSVITADLKVYNDQCFVDLSCNISICRHANIITELKQSYIKYIRSQRPKQRFLGQNGKHGNKKIVVLYFSTHLPMSIVMSISEDNNVYIYELPKIELTLVQGIKPNPFIEQYIKKWIEK